ncbi:hypothetical protein D5086_006829 [Populus alba]|uniref:Uncharacterized protein n=1 Tax=Populus alba TaxID=43335 RepID=A0ACC4CN36_POPAL
MGIDLEQPSGEYHKEDRRPNVNVNTVDGGGGGHERDQIIVNSPDIGGNGCEKTGTVINRRVLDGRKKPNAGDGINLNSVKDAEPHDGMEFESKDEAFSFYKEYAKSVGFSTITKASRRSRISGKFIDAKFVCTRYGNKRDTSTIELPQPVSNADAATSLPVKRKRGRINQSWSKTDCKACMHVKRRQQDGRWVVRSFIKEHNHEIFPDQAYYFRGHRNLNLGNDNVDALHAIRARTKKLYVAMSRQSGGHRKHENQKGGVTNPSGNTKHLALDEGDAQAMLDHFMHMQDENPNFFYAVDLNEEQQLRNVFWVDAKGSLSQESYNIAFNALEDALRKCENVNNSIQNIIEPTSPPSNGPLDYDEVNQAHGATKTSRKKDTSRKKQVHPDPEVIPIRMHDSWQQMEQLNSRVPTLDGYFGSQQTGQGMGQLNAIAPNDDAHYMMQQRMQGMGQIQFRPQTIPSFFDVQDGLQEMVFKVLLGLSGMVASIGYLHGGFTPISGLIKSGILSVAWLGN